jgi:hypothetical protein
LFIVIDENYHSQLEEMQDKEMLHGLGSKVSSNSCEQRFLEYLLNEPKQLFDTSTSPRDGEAWQGEQLEKNRANILEIIQILRTTKVRQCKGKYYDDGKFSAVRAVMHKIYGWNGEREMCTSSREHVSVFHEDPLKIIISLNDFDGKHFSEIADSLEKMYLADRI